MAPAPMAKLGICYILMRKNLFAFLLLNYSFKFHMSLQISTAVDMLPSIFKF